MKKIISLAAIIFYLGNGAPASAKIIEVKTDFQGDTFQPATLPTLTAVRGEFDKYLSDPSFSNLDLFDRNSPDFGLYNPNLGDLVRVDFILESRMTFHSTNVNHIEADIAWDVGGESIYNTITDSLHDADHLSYQIPTQEKKEVLGEPEALIPQINTFVFEGTHSYSGDDLDDFRVPGNIFTFKFTPTGSYRGSNDSFEFDPDNPDSGAYCCFMDAELDFTLSTVYVYDDGLVAHAPLPASFWCLSIVPLGFAAMGWRKRTLQRKAAAA